MSFRLIILFFLGLMLAPNLAQAQCNPSNAPPGSIGCQPYLGPSVSTDQVLIWRASTFPNSSGTVYVSDLLNSLSTSTIPSITVTGLTSTGSLKINGDTLSLAGNLSTTGAYTSNFTFTGATSVTFPTSGTLVTSASIAGTYATVASPTFTGTVTIPNIALSGGAITGTTISGSTGSFTTLAASSTVSGTGFSTYLAAPPAIGTTTPAAGKFTTLQATSTITPSTTAGIVGTTLADNAQTGSVGEYLTATGTAVTLSAGVLSNLTSISLTAGDWDVSGDVYLVSSAGFSNAEIGVSTTSATFVAPPTNGQTVAIALEGSALFNTSALAVGPARINVSTTTTVYLVVGMSFSSGTNTATGFIRARRVR